jgi:PTS system nitrogen regulatory IIA component
MQLSLRDAARLLHVAERTLVRAADAGELRSQRLQEQLRFHPVELLEWATARRLAIAPELIERRSGEEIATRLASVRPPPSFSEALAAGGVHVDLPGADREAVLSEVVRRLPLAEDADRHLFLSFLIARENSGSTALDDGIAIPHVRSPLVLPGARPVVTLAHLAQPVDFRAADGRPTRTLFTFVTATVRQHLHLLSLLGVLLRDAAVRAVLARRAGRDDSLAVFRAAELALLDRAPPPAAAERPA